jgi:hypothetical protein
MANKFKDELIDLWTDFYNTDKIYDVVFVSDDLIEVKCENKKVANEFADYIMAKYNAPICYDFRKGNDCYQFSISPSLMIRESKKNLKESYDPTDDVFNRGLAVTMSLKDFNVMVDNIGINLGKHVSKFNLRTSDITVRGKSFTSVSDNLIGGLGEDHSFSIKSKDIEEVRSVIFDNNILSADFVTKEGNVLTVWWEL